MNLFIAGLVLFFGLHSISVFALPLRNSLAAKNEKAWKGIYALLSLLGLVLMSMGYSELRQAPTILYVTPDWMRHVAALLLLPTFVFFLSSIFPGKIKDALKHPLLAAVKLWALAHLLVNGTLADVLMFGAFLAWAVLVRISLKTRPERTIPTAPRSPANDAIAVVLGLGLYLAFVLWLHEVLIGISPIS